MAIRIAVTEDHAVVRQGLWTDFELNPELKVVGEAENGAEAVQLARETNLEVVLVDIPMQIMDGITAISTLRSATPNVGSIAPTGLLEDASTLGAVRAQPSI